MTVTHDDDGTVTLRLSSVDEIHQGEYTVIANNEKGSETATAMLMVIGKAALLPQLSPAQATKQPIRKSRKTAFLEITA